MPSGVWEDVVEGLLDHHRVTVLDLPGHGYSRASGSDHTLDDSDPRPRSESAGWPGWRADNPLRSMRTDSAILILAMAR
jgi:pimeloyl-ACP methyl ester carboxylesterase